MEAKAIAVSLLAAFNVGAWSQTYHEAMRTGAPALPSLTVEDNSRGRFIAGTVVVLGFPGIVAGNVEVLAVDKVLSAVKQAGATPGNTYN